MVGAPRIELEPIDILFISDDQDLAEMYRLKLELDGYWVRVVPPPNAVAAARMQRPELVFLDVPPGRTDRLSLLGDIRKAMRRPDLPAIVLTSNRREEIDGRLVPLSACDYVVKVPDGRSASVMAG
jgi:DNA-binding response OmpR family regulator